MIKKILKKISLYMLTALIFFSAVCVLSTKPVHAIDSCEAFGVYYINDEGEYELKDCKGSLSEAKSVMKSLGEDYVVKHDKSMSPSKIVAMNSGIVYSYPYRTNDRNTLYVYQNQNHGSGIYDSKNTYVAPFEEMLYKDTISFDTNTSSGDVAVICYGFTSYVRIDDVDLVPSKFINTNRSFTLGGTPSRDKVTVKVQRNFYSVENGELKYTYYSFGSRSGESLYPYSFTFAKAADFMSEGSKYYSSNGYDFYSDINETNKVGTYYNYYQFLPFRSKANVTASELNDFINSKVGSSESKMKNSGQYFINAQEKYGVNALMLFGIACNESRFGTSGYAKTRNNLFGINAGDSNPNDATYYSSVEQCINTMAKTYIERYIDEYDWRFFGSHLGNKGSGINFKYASDPIWGIKAAYYAYSIDKIISGGDINNLKNYDKCDLSVINTYDIPLKATDSDSSKTYRTTSYGPTYQNNFIVITLGEANNSYTKIQSTNPISNGNMISKDDIDTYDFNSSVCYVKSSYLNKINRLNVEQRATGEFVSVVDKVETTSTGLHIQGKAYTPGLSIPSSMISTTLDVLKDGSVYKTYNPTKTVLADVVSYDVNIPVSELENNTYTFRVNTSYAGYSQFNDSAIISYTSSISRKTIGDKVVTFGISTNGLKMTVMNKDTSSLSVARNFKKFEIKDNKLSIDGIAFFNYIDFTADDDISYKLRLFNQRTLETTDFDLETYDHTFTDNSGYRYERIGFKGEVDLAGISLGDYYVQLVIRNGKYEKTVYVVANDAVNEVGEIKYTVLEDEVSETEADKTNQEYGNGQTSSSKEVEKTKRYNLIAQQNTNLLYELAIVNNTLDAGKIHTPSIKTTYFSYSDLKYDNAILNITGGKAFMRNLAYSDLTKISSKMILFNESNGNKYEYDLKSKQCEFDIDAIINSNYSVKNSCFDASNIDLSSVEIGTYKMYVKTSNAPYSDVIQMTALYPITYNEVIKGGNVYQIFANQANKMYLEVKGVE